MRKNLTLPRTLVSSFDCIGDISDKSFMMVTSKDYVRNDHPHQDTDQIFSIEHRRDSFIHTVEKKEQIHTNLEFT